jgi:hypothetical protein
VIDAAPSGTTFSKQKEYEQRYFPVLLFDLKFLLRTCGNCSRNFKSAAAVRYDRYRAKKPGSSRLFAALPQRQKRENTRLPRWRAWLVWRASDVERFLSTAK